jgi:methionine synthase II (cobalamin-independent)
MSDLTEATRELFVRSLKKEVFIRMPFYEELERRRQITFRGGKYIERLTDMDSGMMVTGKSKMRTQAAKSSCSTL